MTNQSVQLTIDVQKTGLSNLTQVIAEMDKAGVETSEFKKQAEQLAKQLADMERQQGLVAQFTKLKQETTAAAQAFEAAQAKAQAMGKELSSVEAPTRKQTAEFERARAAVNNTKDAYQAAQLRLQSMRGTLAENNIETVGLAQKQAALNQGMRAVEKQVKATTERLQELGSQGPKALSEASQAAKDSVKDFDGLSAAGDGLKTKLTGVATAVTGLFAAAKLKDFAMDAVETADAYGQMAARIKMATPIGAEYAVVQKRILDAANLTYRPLKEQQTLYIETADALRELGYSTQQALDIQDSFAYLLTTNAASQEHGKNAIDAYTKSINSGRVEVDAWQSLLAATPTIIDAVAAATGKTTGEVRQLGITGKLSVADLNEGLRQSVESNKQLAAGMSTTVKDAVQRLSNTWQTYIGEANQATQSTSKIVKLVDMLSNNLDTVVQVATTAGEVMVAVWAVKGVAALGAYIVQLKLAIAETERLAATASTSGAAAAGALSKAGHVAAAAWIGWEIGTLLRSRFEVVQKAGILMAELLTKSAARVQGAWEMVQAAFTSDTIAAASARMQQRLKEIDAVYADMYASVGKAAQAQTTLAAATNVSATAAENAKVKWEQYKSSFSQVSEKLTLHAQQIESMVALRNAEAAGIAAIAKEMGTEKEARQAAADAAAVQAEQAKVLARQAGFELEAVRSHRDALVALGAEVLKNDPIRQKELDTLNAEVKARTSAAGQAIAHARSLEVAATSAKAEVAAIQDNSSRVKELGEEYEKARKNLELLRRLQSMGIKAQEDVAVAENALVKASKEYKDALSDQVQAVKASQITKVSEAQATVSMLEAQKSLASQTEQIAALMGDETAVRRAKILQLEIDIKLTKAKADVAHAEAEGSIEVANAILVEMKAKGEINPVKEAEINASIRSAKAKLAEADAIRKSADVTEKELSKLRSGASDAGNGISKSMGHARDSVESVGDAARDASGAFDGMRGSADAAAAAAARAADKYGPVNADKYGPVGGTPPPHKLSDADKLSGYQTVDNMGHASRTAGNALANRQAIIEWLKGAGLDEAVAEYISRDFVDAKGAVPYMNNAGQSKWRGNTMTDALSKAVDYYKYGQGQTEAENLAARAAAEKEAKEKRKNAASSTPVTAPAPSSASSGSSSGTGSTYVSHVYLSLDSKKYDPVRTDPQGAMTMENFLRDLKLSKGVSQ